ncbi:hypothetical protein I601_2760 [Nocardioides dokdonensis FR1436]|uniref:Uncharacterized protein n=1 Tax=Nocardioides dokdonensis FR1436 TaxID=1300347 RepID=A0A1A9GM74_9ACTN|nr:DUF222 domain-containing protein [Nocardioides dokdonensis]ANH39176.1 hypothetical protein I601_2760 [Nocardioides dokdonensis FR1436]
MTDETVAHSYEDVHTTEGVVGVVLREPSTERSVPELAQCRSGGSVHLVTVEHADVHDLEPSSTSVLALLPFAISGPAPDVARAIQEAQVEELSEAGIVDEIRELEELKARCAARQARLSAALDRRVRERHARSGVRPERQGAGVGAQVALARRESPHRGAQHLGLAKVLVTEMPHTLAAMEAGRCHEWRATLLARETACLSAEHRRVVDTEMMADPGATEGWGDARLVAAAKAIAYRLDPHAAVERARKAVENRFVSLRPAPDTMSYLGALLPVALGVSCWAVLKNAADHARAQGDPRSRGQVMADTLVAAILGSRSQDGDQTAPEVPAVPVAVHLTVSDETLLGAGSEPGWLHDYGPIPAGLCRDLAADAVDRAHATLRRLYTTSAGQLVAMDSRSRTFDGSLRLYIDLRDQTCRTPWCDAPVRHRDHVAAVASDGLTQADNGQGLCAACNLAKEAPDWRSRTVHEPGAPPGLHVVETITPTGHRHRSRSPGLPPPADLQART